MSGKGKAEVEVSSYETKEGEKRSLVGSSDNRGSGSAGSKLVNMWAAIGGASAVGAVTGGIGLAAVGIAEQFQVGPGCLAIAVVSGAIAGGLLGGAGVSIAEFASTSGDMSSEESKKNE